MYQRQPEQRPAPMPFNARAIGEEVLRRIAEIDYLNSPERREKSGQYRETRAIDDQRITHLSTSVDRLTRVAQVAADTERTEQIRTATDEQASDTSDDASRHTHTLTEAGARGYARADVDTDEF